MSKSLIATLVIGDEIEALANYTVPTMEAYAKKVGAEFKILRATEITERLSPYYEKTRFTTFWKNMTEFCILTLTY